MGDEHVPEEQLRVQLTLTQQDQQAIVGAMVQRPALWATAWTMLTAEDFTDDLALYSLFQVMIDIWHECKGKPSEDPYVYEAVLAKVYTAASHHFSEPDFQDMVCWGFGSLDDYWFMHRCERLAAAASLRRIREQLVAWTLALTELYWTGWNGPTILLAPDNDDAGQRGALLSIQRLLDASGSLKARPFEAHTPADARRILAAVLRSIRAAMHRTERFEQKLEHRSIPLAEW